MVDMLIGGFSGGVIFYFIKLVSFYFLTQPLWMRWLRRLAHDTPLGLFIFDFIAGMVLSAVIHSVAGEGLTILFFFVGFSLTSILYIILHSLWGKVRRLTWPSIHGPSYLR